MKKYLVRTKYGGVRVQYSIPDPDELYVVLDELPEGDGPLHITANGEVIRLPVPTNDPDPEAVDLVAENKLLRAQLQAQSDRSDFIEDCIAEMAMAAYGEV